MGVAIFPLLMCPCTYFLLALWYSICIIYFTSLVTVLPGLTVAVSHVKAPSEMNGSKMASGRFNGCPSREEQIMVHLR